MDNTFARVKPACVSLMGNVILTSRTARATVGNLETLLSVLHSLPPGSLTPPLVKYIFFPISHILRRNPPSSISDYVLEKIFMVLELMIEKGWWSSCEIEEWEQLILMAGGLMGGLTGKSKDRDDEVKEAATRLLLSLLSDHSAEAATLSNVANLVHADDPTQRFNLLLRHATTPQFFPKLGQVLNTALEMSLSSYFPLQQSSLRLCHLLLSTYITTSQIPLILPGVVSTTCKVALGDGNEGQRWQKGEIVKSCLEILDVTLVKCIGDKVCIAEGAVRAPVVNLEEFENTAISNGDAMSEESLNGSPFTFHRSASWLRATSSQVHIALSSLSPILAHPNLTAQLALVTLSHSLLVETSVTLPSSQPLLLSYLLSLSLSSFPSLSSFSRFSLRDLLNDPNLSTSTFQLLFRMTQQNMATLPRLIPSRSDSKVEHVARQIEAVCRLYMESKIIRTGVCKLLGPLGGVEKWGYHLLQVLEFDVPAVAPVTSLGAILSLGTDDGGTRSDYPFLPLEMRHIVSSETRLALEGMFRALGEASGEDGLYAVEWFVSVGRRRKKESAAALWCCCRLLEGIAGVGLDEEETRTRREGKRLEKVARRIAKTIAELWEADNEEQEKSDTPEGGATEEDGEETLVVEYKKGITTLTTLLDFNKPSPSQAARSSRNSQTIYTIFSLHLLTLTSSVLTSRFTSLFLYTLYPVLHSLVSPTIPIASTAQSALYQISLNTSYASPANLLLSNFDYALDDVSRRLTRTNLDVQATKVLGALVRVVGKDVVWRAGDVVEECFDRVDEFHGYAGVVEGLVDVVGEVVKAVAVEDGEDAMNKAKKREDVGESSMEGFVQWFKHRHDGDDAIKEEDFGPVPQKAWGPSNEEEIQDSNNNETFPPKPEDEDSRRTPELSPTQSLVRLILSRSLPLLTHPSSRIRSRILSLLSTSIPILRTSPSSILSSVHKAWPFIINRLQEDSEPGYVVSEAAGLIEALAINVGDYIAQKVWDDVWPRFRKLLSRLDEAESNSALMRRDGSFEMRSIYSHSHRLYKALLGTLKAVIEGVQLKDEVSWDVALMCRRFLSAKHTHEELQARAREVYGELGKGNGDMVWLVLCGTCGRDPRVSEGWDDKDGKMKFLRVEGWDLEDNVCLVLDSIG